MGGGSCPGDKEGGITGIVEGGKSHSFIHYRCGRRIELDRNELRDTDR